MNNWFLQKTDIVKTITIKEYVKEHENGSIEFLTLKKFKHILKYNYYVNYVKLNPISNINNDHNTEIYETAESYNLILTKKEFEDNFNIHEEFINTISDLYDA